MGGVEGVQRFTGIARSRGRPSATGSRARLARCAGLLDHLIHAQQDRGRNGQSERLRGLQVDHQAERGRALDGKFARRRAPGPWSVRNGTFPSITSAALPGRSAWTSESFSALPALHGSLPGSQPEHHLKILNQPWRVLPCEVGDLFETGQVRLWPRRARGQTR
jgi:hypothetical protein